MVRGVSVDRAGGVMLAAVGVVATVEALRLPRGTLAQPGPGLFPLVLAVGLAVLGVGVAASAGGPRLDLARAEWRHGLGILGAIAFAALGLERLGYRATIALALVFLLRVIEQKSWAGAVGVAVGFAWASHYLFATLLRVPLPRGWWG